MSYSEEYHRALKEATEHHESSKTYSGKFLRPHAPAIKKLIEQHQANTLLDYGCGKGKQYQWVSHGEDASIPEGMTIEQYWGMPVTKFDPAYAPFAQRPEGKFDIVICTHVLGSIPLKDLPVVLAELVTYARKAIYIAEKIGPVRKQVFSAPGQMPRWSSAEWASFIQMEREGYKRPEIWLATREKTERGVITEVKRL